MKRLWTVAIRLGIALIVAAMVGAVVARQRREQPPRPALNAVIVAGATQLPLGGDDFLPLVCEPACGDLQFVDPVQSASLPDGSGRLLVAERTGRIQLVDPTADPPIVTTFLDLTSLVFMTPYTAEEGILSIAFHPQYSKPRSPHCGELFVYYTAKTPAGRTNRLSRFRVFPHVQAIDPASEEVLIDQLDRHEAHNAGSLAFGPDGFLYFSRGDDANQRLNGQNLSGDLFSGVLRLDVDCRGGSLSHPPPRQPEHGKTAGYYIPSDNPFVGQSGVLEEFFALGLRNPWRMSFDSHTGRLYVSDVGERTREEVNVVLPGANLGWPYAEGTLVKVHHDPQADARPKQYYGRETWPIHEYPRDFAHRCIIGGHVYRGSQFPELSGHYIYADQSGRIYALRLGNDGRRVRGNRLLAVVPNLKMGLSSVDVDERGELLICAIGTLETKTGRIYRLARPAPNQASLPPTLADTGLFSNWRRLEPAQHLVSYDVNVPLWSDGAEKQRWIALPPGTAVECSSDGTFRFPAGTVFVKHFELATDLRQPNVRRPLETRVLVVESDGAVHGAAYRWSVDGKRTRRLTFAETETISVIEAEGRVRSQVWQYPGRFDCLMCHNDASGYVLGFAAKQLAGKVASLNSEVHCLESADGQPQRADEEPDELARLMNCGVIRACGDPSTRPDVRPLVPIDCQHEPLVDRVRSYLDVNCSACHNPGRYFSAFDARLERHPDQQGIIEGPSYYHAEFGGAMRIIKPGSVELSVAHLRLSSSDPHLRMPPLGSTVVDEQARQVLAEWIQSLAPAATAAKEGKSNALK